MATPVRPTQPKPRAKSRMSMDRAMDVDNSASTSDGQKVTGVKRTSLEAMLDDTVSVLNPKVMVPYITKVGEVPRKVQIERIQVHFQAEDPFLFVKRVKAAHDARAKAEVELKYNCYIKAMPIEDRTYMTPEQLERVKAHTYNTKFMKEKLMDVSGLLTEANTDYGNVMNKLTFDDSLKYKPTPSNEFIVEMDVEFPPDEPKKPVPRSGTVEVPEYDYEEQASEFYFMSCLTRPEVIIATAKLRFECNKIPKMTLLSTHYIKSMRLDEFESMETQTAEQALLHLKESWLTLLRNIIRSSFKDAGKGWFNIKEASLEAYRASKMKRYLTMVRYIMEDALRYLVEETLERYTVFIEKQCGGPMVEIVDTDEANCTWPQQDFAAMVKKPPLFALEIVTAEGGIFEYNTQLKNFEEVTVRSLEFAVKCLQTIPQIEASIMENQFWSKVPNLSTPMLEEPLIIALKSRVQVAIRKAMTVARLYLDKYVEFEPLLKMDVPKYKAELIAKKLSLKDLLEEVRAHKAEQDNLDRRIPNSISFGTFQITCKKIRQSLLQKKQQLCDIVMQLIASTPKQLGEDKHKRFEEIEKQLKIKTHNPEEVAAQKDFILTVPGKVIELKQEIDQLEVYYTAMDDLQYALTDGDFGQKWTLLTWPTKIEKLCEKIEKSLAVDNERYQKEMEAEQALFVNTLESVDATVTTFNNYTDMGQVELVSYEARECADKLRKAEAATRLFNSREALFGVPPTDYSRLKRIQEAFEPFNYLWVAADEWKKRYKGWMEDSWNNLVPDDVEKLVMGWWKGLFKYGREFSKRDLMTQATYCEDIRAQVGEFKPYVPLIAALRQPGMRDRHWDEISKQINLDVHPTDAFTLQQGIQMGLLNHLPILEEVADLASKEFGIENQLSKMESDWKSLDLQILEYKETGTYIMKIEEATLQQLDDHIVLTQAMSFSPFKKPFEDKIAKWEQLLQLVSEVVEEWLMVQRQWMYLEPIFSSPDIQTQLPIESKRFQTVNNIWRKALAQAHTTPQILTMCSSKKLLEQFRESNRLLDLVQKGLADYLETKRLAFSRFFFLSNDELLQILSQAKNPLAVQPHLHKCFEAIDSLDFKKDLEITAMNSAEGEKIPFSASMSPIGNVENWLSQVEQRMKESVHQQIKLAVTAYRNTVRTQWVQEWPGQVVLAGSSVYWTMGVEGAIRQANLQEFFDTVQVVQLEGLTDLVRAPLSKLARLTLGALIVIDVHARDVVQALINEKVKAPTDFEWVSQLRYYWENEGIWVKMVQASIVYGYEYLGNTPRLVITPLTDRCYMTLMGALHLNLGGAPAGPAGTGKTETTKDLAKALAKQCVVFNCSDGLDYLAMGKFFKGLASSGAWACFDEFNRIDLEVLSVIAQQILTIQLAIQQKVKRFIFEDTEISLDPSCSVYITMNPGYAGRSELPDNLKALFRPCAMMVPDYALIGEISLFSFGFRKAKGLAQKMVATFKLCSEQLSSQDHYDYGMRAVKSVIVAAGNLKRSYPDEDEDVLLLRGLRDINVPKFLSQDLPLFAGIITDLFPGVEPPAISYDDLIGALVTVGKDLNIQAVEAFTTKVIQLYETTIVRHGLMLVGPTGGGKTANYRSLAGAMSLLNTQGSTVYEKVRIACLNPKSITMGQLYGDFDENTHEWTDGVLACYMRELAEDPSPAKKWLMFDGPVDAIWIENMNTVLDDNKKLCLVSGEIIQMSQTMTMMFEVEDLAVASPATVSRCGMVFMEPFARGFDPLLTSWLQRIPKHVSAFADKFTFWFRNISVVATRLVRKSLKQTVATSDDNLILSMFNIMDALMAPYCKDGGLEVMTDEEKQRLPKIIEPLFMFATCWSAGASCDNESRSKFDLHIRESMKEHKIEIPYPEGMDVFQYSYDHVNLQWVEWMTTIPKYTCDPKTPFSELIVPTAGVVGYKSVIHALLVIGKHVLCVGETGTGKTLVVRDKLLNYMDPVYVPMFINFSARTGANQTQDLIDSKTEKRRKGVYGPPAMKKYVIFVDDVNMPQREKYFAQPPIEILRQWMDHKGWYDRHPPCAFRTIVDIQFVGCMGPPGGGRNPVTMRFLRHFNFLSFTEMPDDSLKLIFSTILNATFVLGFPDDVKAAADSIVIGTIDVYNTIRRELLPTPAKSHYTFNLRDLSKVIQGVLRADPKTTKELKPVIKLWVHEAMRVFQDRLINNEDRSWFRNLLATQLQKYFDMKWDTLFSIDRVIFGDFFIPGAEPRLYEEITELEQLQKVMYEYLEQYNSNSNAPMNLVLFLDAIEHVSRVCRVIRLPLGNALLLGVGGSGRQSLSKLATFIEEYEIIQVEIAKGYGNNEWKEDLKKVLYKAGLDDKETVFLFSDTQILMESFLEDINNILNSGEVPNLWKNEDLDIIATAMRPILLAAGTPVTKLNLQTAFLKRVRQNLHVVLAMSPIGDAFRTRLRMFPSLVNCCTIDWFSEWPEEALKSVANNFLTATGLFTPEEVQKVVKVCVYIHQSVERRSADFLQELNRHNYVTPTSYLELLQLFIKLMGEKKSDLQGLKGRLEAGLDKLLTTAQEVEVMQEELKRLQPILQATAKEADEMMAVISNDKKAADITKAEVGKQEAEANKMAAKAKAIADSAQAELDKALPALEAALSSLKLLTRNDIVEVKSLRNPPEGVKMVMEACCIMFQQAPKMVADPNKLGKKLADYWDASTKMLTDPTKFLDSLLGFDKDNIPESVIVKIEPFITMEAFTPEQVARVSKACTSICMWVRAMHSYYLVCKVVAPKRAQLAEAQGVLDAVLAQLHDAQAKLKEVESKIALLEADLSAAVAKKDALAKQASDCEKKLSNADKLIGGLGGERTRWIANIASLEIDIKNVIGDVAVAAGAIAYTGPFTPPYREKFNLDWVRLVKELELPHTPAITLQGCLKDPVKMRAWNIAGLPSDTLSEDNGIIVSKARRWPLMIDPQGQANKWIKNMYRDIGLDVIKLSEKDYLRTLENGVRFGRVVLLENVLEALDPALEPLLLQQTYKQGGQEVIKIGENIIPYHKDFKFYITTKLRNPHYAPEVSVKVTLLNFFVTPEGLEDQLLGNVVTKERPDLAEMKTQLTLSNASMKRELKELETKILFLLSNAQGNILEDETLINTLAQSKITSDEIKLKVVEAEKTEVAIDETREVYRKVATRASLLFFCISDLALVDPMYQYSLPWFIGLFVRAMESAAQSTVIDKRIENLNEYFTYSLYVNVCRSLFEKHKLMFSMMLCIKILQGKGEVDSLEWRFLLSGGISSVLTLKNPAPDWLTDKDFVTHHLGQRFIEPPAFDLATCFKDGTPNSPLIFVLSPGADPMADLLKLAEDHRFTKKFEKVSLGQGQGPKAEKLLAQGMERGMWVCLQNCHLSQSWMPALDRIVDNIDPEKVHKDFRLWLTSMPSPDFPVAILQNGVKMTLEPPKGLRSNMIRSYLRYTDKQLNDCAKPDEWKRLVFATCLFHAVIQERRKFGPLGWNIRYDFTDGDLSVCQVQIRMFLNDYEDIPFKVIRFLCGEINYGGRVTDDKDRRLMNTLLQTFVTAEVCTEKGYKFSESGVFCIPDASNCNAFLTYCREIPLAPKPEIFGLHENADITCDQNESNDLYGTVLTLQPRESASGTGMSREDIIEKKCKDMLAVVPPVYDVEVVLQKYPTMYNESMNTVLTQECIRYNGLLSVMKRSLQDALKALKGLVVMSPDLEMLCNSIFLNLVPEMWQGKAYPSLKPLSAWIDDLLERCKFISKWIAEGVPAVIWISGFFFPQAFLTGTLQNFARKHRMAIDTVSFDYQEMDTDSVKTLTRQPESGCYIRGLYLEGARWDSQAHLLTESRPKELFTDCPIIWLKPTQHRVPPTGGIYLCPVYKTLVRAGTLSTTGHSTNFVMYLELKSEKKQAWWINRGVGLFTALAY
ncbi:hypothetical protein Mp_5g13570 [Marchantia polymorpha subsp. ruderalis]|uniref:Uncharacterized protein n=2 Tax=Marchantia polymorpha TaxID=3197 RepID=A0AAF6BI03_MARPO|nr:hypothetical protein MARPO_0032s0050 [Marchantia polymorpha]BBN11637.1 hypothetical protein Mp_5g13570 [Marchantia polymorpha subsp. ruderalis]|eukprot:PTQ41851.1 hypothetical protein MARPO_0032s0050 [Marchantia polymorpha]